MKKLLLFATTYMVALFFSCSNDFEVNADWKDIPIVYGLLDIKDSAYYIRVEKAFLPDGEDATKIAKIADSIYYKNASVKLERLSNGDIFTLELVDGNDWGRQRDSGAFASEPNWLFRIDSADIKLRAEERYKLHIDRGNGLPEVTSEAMILPPIKLISPGPNTLGFTFSSNGVAKTNVSFEAPDSASIFDVTLFIKYAEYPILDPSKIEYKTLPWEWEKGLRRENSSNNIKTEKVGLDFYRFMANNIPDDENLKRVFIGIDVEIVGGDNNVESYVNVSAANTGITASQELPTFSNMSEGRGIFSSISKISKYGIGLSDGTRDTLRMGYLTKNLNF